MFCVTYVTMNIQNVLLWLECRYGDDCATIDDIVNNAHSKPHVNQMPPQIIDILSFFR